LALLDLLAAARLVFAAVLANVADSARVAFPEDALEVFLEVFLRVFLDIRLPFVAFSGSIIRLLRVVSR
jgi:hypothetical protein